MLEQVFLLTLSLIELTEQSEYLTIGKLFKNNITFFQSIYCTMLIRNAFISEET